MSHGKNQTIKRHKRNNKLRENRIEYTKQEQVELKAKRIKKRIIDHAVAPTIKDSIKRRGFFKRLFSK